MTEEKFWKVLTVNESGMKLYRFFNHGGVDRRRQIIHKLMSEGYRAVSFECFTSSLKEK